MGDYAAPSGEPVHTRSDFIAALEREPWSD
jgi:hypothetical protein